MSERSYAPPLGIEGATSTLDPDMVSAFALALRMHEGRYLVLEKPVAVTQPAAGSDWFVAVPGGVTWIVLGINARFITSAVVANRSVDLRIQTSDNIVYSAIPPLAAQAASIGGFFYWQRGIACAWNAGSNKQGIPFPLVPVTQNMRIQTSTTNIDVGDQWSQIAMSVLEIRERTPNERACYMEDLLAGRPTTDYPGLLLGL